MSLLKLAVPLLVLALVPLATASPPTNVGAITISAGDVTGLIKEDNQMVVAYKGNATVPVRIIVDCSLLVYEASQNSGQPGLHVEVMDPAPEWLVAEEVKLDASPSKVGPTCAAGTGKTTFDVVFPFSVAAGAPSILTQSFNLTANLREDIRAAPAQVLFAVQFHSDYTVTPSIQFPYTVTGRSVNFTVTAVNNGNSRSMIMFEGLEASTGAFGGLVSQAYEPPASKVFAVTFKAPETCWTEATIKFHTASHFLTLGQQAGTYKDERDFDWKFTNGVSCTASKDTKKSPIGGLVLIPALLGVAFLMRRKLL